MSREVRYTLLRVRAVFLAIIILSSTIASTAGALNNKYDQIFYQNNDILFYDPTSCNVDGTESNTTSLEGKDRAEQIWNFLIGKGLSAEQAAGVMGNMSVETGGTFDPDIEQRDGGGGYGIAQWTGGRRTNLENEARKNDKAVSDLAFQLNYLYQESKSRVVTSKVADQGFAKAGDVEWEALTKQATIRNATVFWHNSFEVSADSAAKVIAARGGAANDIYNQFKDKTPSANNSTSTAITKPVIFLDPGHGGAIARYTDRESGLVTDENPNSPEREDAIDVANQVKAKLENDGYSVLLSHSNPTDAVKFRDRVNAANAAKASLAVSIHTTPGEVNEVWPQRVGTYREYKSHKETFTNEKTAKTSQDAAAAMAKSRTESEGHVVTTDPDNKQQASSFNRAGIESKGNISLLQLWSTNVPWIYNEIGQDKGTSISESRKAAYAKGIVEGIEAAVPAKSKGAVNSCGEETGGVFDGGDLAQTTLAYAWHTYKGSGFIDARTEYTTAVKKARSEGRYVGGVDANGNTPGIDCGGFITTLMIDSGFEPKYNKSGKGGYTAIQESWARENWKTLGRGSSINTASLRPGDVAFLPGHTFVYVGKIEGFNSNIASASLHDRAPMAGKESITSGAVMWYGKR
jgi:N-acetylmuramoyl-L-alanine amidase